MKVILQEDVPTLGTTGDVLDVADGYGRNFLLPRRLAVLADAQSTNKIEHQKRMAAARQARVVADAQALAAQITATAVSFKRKAAGKDELDLKIFGAVTNQDIAEALEAQGVKVDKRAIVLAEPIRALGRSQVAVKVHPGVEAMVTVFVQRG